MTIEGFEAELYSVNNAPYFMQELSLLTPEDVIEEYRKTTARLLDNGFCPGLEPTAYPSPKMMLIETPVAFHSFFRPWKRGSEFIQPETLFWPERGATFPTYGLKKMYAIFKRNLHERGSEKNIQKSLLGSLVDYITMENNLHAREEGYFIMENNKYNSVPLFYTNMNYIRSDEYPTMDFIVKNIVEAEKWFPRFFCYMTSVTTQNLQALEYLNTHSLEEALHDRGMDYRTLEEIVRLKSIDLMNYISLHVSREEAIRWFHDIYFPGNQETSLNPVIQNFNARTGIDLSDYIKKWYTAKDLPEIVVKDIHFFKVQRGDSITGAVHIKVHNPSRTDVILQGAVPAYHSPYEKETLPTIHSYLIPAGSTKRVQFSCNYFPSTVSIQVGTSKNIPNSIEYRRDLSAKECWLDKSADIEGSFDDPTGSFDSNPHELIVDNEELGFQLISPKFLKLKNIVQNDPHEHQPVMCLANKWTKHYDASYHGTPVKSVYYKMGGNGKYKARWEACIKEPGEYEIFTLLHNTSLGIGPKFKTAPKNATLSYTIKGDLEQDITFPIPLFYEQQKWLSLGIFHFKEGKASVTLSDKGTPEQIIIADAVKWIKVGK